MHDCANYEITITCTLLFHRVYLCTQYMPPLLDLPLRHDIPNQYDSNFFIFPNFNSH